MSDGGVASTALDEHVLEFGDGIPGFPRAHRFVLRDLTDDGPFQMLESLDQPDLSMVVAVPWLFFPDYAPELAAEDQEDLGIERPEDAIVFCTVTADLDEEAVYLNLLGPFVVNARTRQGRQVVLADTSQPVRARVALGP